MNILILCTGNSCRSQMAHGFLQSFNKQINVASAGTEASGNINLKAMEVMREIGVDISHHTSDSIEKYLHDEWDYVITVCDDANETCPVFIGSVKKRLHIGFEDPSKTKGKEEFIMREFRKVRDEINAEFYKFYKNLRI